MTTQQDDVTYVYMNVIFLPKPNSPIDLFLERYNQKCSDSTQPILSPDARYTFLQYETS